MPLPTNRPKFNDDDENKDSNPGKDLALPENNDKAAVDSSDDSRADLIKPNPDLAPITKQRYLEDDDSMPGLPKRPASQVYSRGDSPLNLQGYTNIGRLTADDLLEKDYATNFAPLQAKVLEVRQTIQDVLQNQNRTEAVGEARAERGEKYTAMRQEIDQLLTRHFATERNIRREDVPTVAALVANEILGLGPIEPLWLDPRITEIMVNGPEQVFVEMAGKLYFVQGAQFRDQRHLIDVAQQILGAINRVIDFAHPLEDGRLSDGSRINITHPAVGPGGPYLTIRRFPDTTFTIRELIDRNSMTEEMAVQIANLVASGCSTVVVGGTGSGKTSFLNAISGCIPRDERIITIEDNLELQLHPKAHVVAMEARRSNREDGAGSVSIRQLVRNALRQRPDRIVVGEVRDASAYDMLQAMNTGHDGSLTTVHANDALGGINRLVNLMGEADIETNRALSLIAGGVDMLVVIDRFPEDGSRRVVSVEEIPSRVNFENGEGHLEPITLFEYRQTGIEQVDGRDKVVGEYVKVNDISPDMIRKHRLDRKDVLDIEQVYKLSDHN